VSLKQPLWSLTCNPNVDGELTNTS